MRAILVAFVGLLIVPALAGCLSADEESAAARARRAAGSNPIAPVIPQTFVAALADGTLADLSKLNVTPLVGEQRFLGTRTFEPTIGINKAGHLFMVAFANNPSARIYKSTDQGVSWKDTTAKVGPVNNPPNSNDPFVWVDRETGRVFASDLQALMCSWLNFSDDGGATWTTNPIGCGHPFGVHDHQSIATGKARTLPSTWQGRNVYYCVNRVFDSACAVSTNGGLAFGPLMTVTQAGVDVERAGPCFSLTGHVKTDNAGRVFLGKAQCSVPLVAVSENDGLTWTSAVVSRTTGIRDHDVETAHDAKDNSYAIWLSSRGLPMLSISKDHGKTWGPAISVAPPGVTAAQFPSIAASAEGKIAFSYLGTRQEGGFSSSNWDSASWHGYVGVMTDALAENPLILTTMVDSEEDPMAKGRCNNRCNGMGDFFDIEIDPQGRPWTAFVDVCGAECVKSGRNDANGNQGVSGTLTTGPALTAEGGALPPLPALAAATVAKTD